MTSSKNETTISSEERGLSRRAVLIGAGAVGVAAPFGLLGVAHAITGLGGIAPLAPALDGSICRAAAPASAARDGVARKLKLAWNATAICTASAPIAQERGIFAAHGLDVEFVNFGGSTEQLLEAIATGKADAGIGMALRWIKPLEQGFDVRITAGVHGGCLRLLAGKSTGIAKIEDLKGKTVAIADQASPAKNFFSVVLAKHGLDPVKDVEWRNYPTEVLPLAIEKGEAQALADNDPRTFLWLKDGKLNEIATNLSGEYAGRTCCVLAVRGSLLREERNVATALTQAVLEAGHIVATNPADAATVFSGYGGKGSVEDLTAMLRSHTHHSQVTGADLKLQIAAYADELKLVNVVKQSTDTAKFADRVFADVLS